ncbi:ABC transporter permease [Bacillus cereus]|uniref:ABC transporter permease n=1 Tax=Bacillus cereus TaxID=1396 RepID=UPI0018CE6F1F|nr:ABC transporter permease [Bacillus cereus]MBG9615786.1 ABC transporter permease [Bacillus cereus]
MLLKLSISSMRKMMKDYIVLLAGLVISISIFYMFQTLAMNTAFTKHNSVISSIVQVFQMGSILLMFVSFFYIFYANSFLLSLRRKELGMYLILGAKKHQISHLLFWETLGMGGGALILGSILGMLLSKLVSFLLIQQLAISLEGYQAFYLPAWSQTCYFFCILFFLTAILNATRLSLQTELHLIRTEQTIDRMLTKGLTTVSLVIIGITGIGVGYYLVMGPGIKKVSDIQIPLFTITVGTYLLFTALLPLLVNILKKTSLNERYINAFTFAQVRFRVNNLAKMLGTVTMLIGIGVGAMAGSMSLQQNAELRANKTQVYDITILSPENADYAALENMKITEKNQYRYKSTDQAIYYLKDDLVAHPPLVFLNQEENQPHRITEKMQEGSYNMFNSNRNNQMYKPLPPEWIRAMAFEFRINKQIFDQKPVYIVDKNQYTSISGAEYVFLVAKVDNFLKYKNELKEIDARHKKQLPTSHKEETLVTKYGMYEGMLAFSKGTVFMGIFLGIAFLAMMASCLMFKVLSGATRDIERYHMLCKIGVRKTLLEKSVYKEIGFIFVFPAIFGLMHVIVGMKVFTYVSIFTNPYINIGVPISIFLIIYTLYYWITVQLYKRIVFPKQL